MLFDELLRQWEPHRSLTSPPPEPIKLWGDDARDVYLDESWGPAVPYPSVRRDNGTTNYGYLRVKGAPEAIARIPEAQDWPELQAFLQAVNAPESPIESVGCEKNYFEVDVPGVPKVKLGSYVDIVFSEPALNDRAENQLFLASHLLEAVEGCGQWWSLVEIGLQRLRYLGGASAPWGLFLRVIAHGRSQEEARKLWGESMRRLTAKVAGLSADFRYEKKAG
jgi:hypothetical protein